jgi:hypothetical protein
MQGIDIVCFKLSQWGYQWEGNSYKPLQEMMMIWLLQPKSKTIYSTLLYNINRIRILY